MSPADQAARIEALAEENRRLKKMNAALIERVEAGSSLAATPYTAFEQAAALAEQVRERTLELTEVNQQLHQEIRERKAVEAHLLEAKREAEEANLSKTKFLAAVSHDLLQPLNAARLFTSALEEKNLEADPQKLVTAASRSLADVESLLRSLVDISKLDAGAVEPEVTRFALGELLDNLGAEYREVAASEGLDLRWVSSRAWVKSDRHLLARILRNFLANALRYTPAGGRVLLGCRYQGLTLRLEVWDSGRGIPADQLQRIFGEFQRVDAEDRQARDQGLGLGLAIVDKMARMLGHHVSVASWPGQGSVFRIHLPLVVASTPDRLPDASQLLGPSLKGQAVWVLDNDAAICEGMLSLLQPWGCLVTTATRAEHLANRLEAGERPELLLVDYHLDAQENGLEVAARLQEALAEELPVIIITANPGQALKAEAKQRGYHLLYKPLRPLRLRQLLHHLLG
ncbi:hybrid sensor histidine kinase/response regulator [Marinospirillum perlucidum]|uniref:hybrid sensor histidine kinase/response regulator n=1 Tax=Marinospirillum perlucidum TaxID=1982602 RepID=UPI000DF23C7B|nr:hybrid sensor histidine kinase/response regulator [Marinospirillum perlucidum]